jgi:hypothetical protein
VRAAAACGYSMHAASRAAPQKMLLLQCSPENVAVAVWCELGNVLVSIGSGLQILGDGGSFRIEAHQDSVKGRHELRKSSNQEPRRTTPTHLFQRARQENQLSRVASVELRKGTGTAGTVCRARRSDISRRRAYHGGDGPLGNLLSAHLGLGRWQGGRARRAQQVCVMAARWHSAGWTLSKRRLGAWKRRGRG